ncbi:MAG: MBL fold metallo-hydrolase [Marinicaulis sp.]|nr:MBL fold metallo-hydrolase [Marinicaulis sp.]
MQRPNVATFFHEATNTATFVVSDPATRRAAIIDSALDFDAASGRTETTHADEVIAFVGAEKLSVDLILETHIHADHLTAAPYLKEQLGGEIGIGSGVVIAQKIFAEIFNAGSDFQPDGSQFDLLFEDGADFAVGDIPARVIHTPGHTPACVTYVIGDAAFVGDTLFMPDFGTARCDFPGGEAKTLYLSIYKILALPDETRLFTGHDYKAPGRDEFAFESCVAEQREKNKHIGGGVSKDEFVEMRETRDAGLNVPKLLLPSVQVNMRAGHFPPVEDNGASYLKIPLNKI